MQRLSSPVDHGHAAVTLEQAVGLLALAGAMALGQPLGHAAQDTPMAARLRWAGRPAAASAGATLQDQVAAEVAGEIAAAMGLPAALESSLRQVRAALAAPAPQQHAAPAPAPAPALFLPASVALTLVADAVELKLPWLAGHSRRVAVLAQRAAAVLGLPEAQQRLLVRAALLHGLGRAAVPNPVWEQPRRLAAGERGAMPQAPYWTARAAGAIAGLEQEAALAAQAWVRLDAGGYARSLEDAGPGMAQRVLAGAVIHVALRSPRPWRPAYAPAAALALLEAEAAGGRLDRDAVRAVSAAASAVPTINTGPAAATDTLSARETDVLRRVSLGQRERDIARALRLSTGAVRTHADAIIDKLGCTTRQGATLRALTLGLI